MPLLQWLKQQLERFQAPPARDFVAAPWLYDRQYIGLYGKVSRVFRDSWQRRLKFALTRQILKHFPKIKIRFRSEHQRFVISSPLLKKGEGLLVVHNVNYGHQPIAQGKWVRFCGQYLHRPGMTRGLWGMRWTHYGLVHATHEPIGFLRVLDTEPMLEEGNNEVQILTREQIQRLYRQNNNDVNPNG
ncbi:MAG: hypothetical protein IT292_03575 [Deltaproteobacteria bacterium]|nr:hypothetical protein [Deltaproteobacteria bacterium]